VSECAPCNTLQHSATPQYRQSGASKYTHGNPLQLATAHCNTLRRTATYLRQKGGASECASLTYAASHITYAASHITYAAPHMQKKQRAVLQSVSVWCRVVQCVTHCNTTLHNPLWENKEIRAAHCTNSFFPQCYTLHHPAHTAPYCTALPHTATRCDTLQHTTMHRNRNTLKRAATYVNTLQQTCSSKTARANALQVRGRHSESEHFAGVHVIYRWCDGHVFYDGNLCVQVCSSVLK